MDGKRDGTDISEQSGAILQHVALLQISLSFFANSMKLRGFTDQLLTADNVRCTICCKVTTPVDAMVIPKTFEKIIMPKLMIRCQG